MTTRTRTKKTSAAAIIKKLAISGITPAKDGKANRKWELLARGFVRANRSLAERCLSFNLLNRPMNMPHVNMLHQKQKDGLFHEFPINFAWLEHERVLQLGNAQHSCEATTRMPARYWMDATLCIHRVKNRTDFFDWLAEYDVENKQRSLADLTSIYVTQAGYEASQLWPTIATALSWRKWASDSQKQERMKKAEVAKLLGDRDFEADRKALWGMFQRYHSIITGPAKKRLFKAAIQLAYLRARDECKSMANNFFAALITDVDHEGRNVEVSPPLKLRHFLLNRVSSGSGKTRKSDKDKIQISGIAAMTETVLKSWSDERLGRVSAEPCLVSPQ